jgi:hyperosmotically inducible protein
MGKLNGGYTMIQYKKISVAFLISCLAATPIMLTSCTSTSTQESTGQFIDSSAITAKVKSKLLAEADLNKLAITVKTYKGVVELSGFVNNYHQQQKALRIARAVEGVQDVKNALVIKPHVAR